MLKRQRPPMPPATVSCLHGPDYDDYGQLHFSKRQRVVAPILDGRERGFQKGDGDAPDEDEDVEDVDGTRDATTVALEWAEQSGRYKHANAVLHKLHLEQQRRIHVSVPQTPHCASRNADGAYPLLDRPPNSAHLSTSSPSSDRPQCITHRVSAEAFQELKHVRARYEEHNRLLGSLVRQRKEQRNILSGA